MRRVHRDVAELVGVGVVGHLQAQWIVRIQHGGVCRDFDRHAFDFGEILERIDAAQAQVVRRHVEAGGNIALLEPEAAAEHAAARRLHDGRIHGRIAQDHLCRNRSGHVPGTLSLPSM